MTRWLGRPNRSPSRAGVAPPRSGAAGPPPPPTEFSLTGLLPGRLLILTTLLLLTLLIVRQFLELPLIVEVFRRVVRLAWLVSVVWIAGLVVAKHRRHFLWRVRQKLILSYVFLGFVPVLLVIALALAGGLVLYMNVAAYMFHEGFSDISRDVIQAAETSAAEVGRTPASAIETVTRKYDNMSARYPALSLAVIPMAAPPGPVPAAVVPAAVVPAAARQAGGPWRHMTPPAQAPSWLVGAGGFHGVVALPSPDAAGEWLLVMRAVALTRDGTRAVVVDLPVDPGIVAEIEANTRTRMGDVHVPESCGGPVGATATRSTPTVSGLFRQTVAFVDCTNWPTGLSAWASISLDAPLGRLYGRVAALQAGRFGGGPDLFLGVLIALGGLFLVIQGSALVMGAMLARSITYAVHELFVGTERVQHGDFAHRISIESGDQLGDLAASFNKMSSSIEHLLHVQRAKQRLDDELRIARDIQKSLLPTTPPLVPGLSIADLCEPAREVGGDYYDFFDLGPRRLGVMVADVSGKGTSAALYMAELKGLMLALTRKEQSPRRLLIEANRLLSVHLDNRSFITMTYAVIDLEAMTMTCARAGHTPLIVVSGDRSDVITPPGMVLGLRLPGAAERFDDLLQEHISPIAAGDVIVLYTDGITEAMNEASDLFSDESLAAVVLAQRHLDAAGIRERVVRDVRAFVGDAEPHDDMTMIILKVGAP